MSDSMRDWDECNCKPSLTGEGPVTEVDALRARAEQLAKWISPNCAPRLPGECPDCDKERADAILAAFEDVTRVKRRACSCPVPDPVMQADGKFYCHACSFETGARPTGLEPERFVAELAAERRAREAAEQALRNLVVAVDARWPAERYGSYSGLSIADELAHAKALLSLRARHDCSADAT